MKTLFHALPSFLNVVIHRHKSTLYLEQSQSNPYKICIQMYSVRGRPPPGSHAVARHPLVRRGRCIKTFVTYSKRTLAFARVTGGYKKSPPRGLPHGGRESCSDLLSRARRPSTIGDRRLNFRVRNGNGCDPPSITAETYTAGRVPGGPKNEPIGKRRGDRAPTMDPGCPRGAELNR